MWSEDRVSVFIDNPGISGEVGFQKLIWENSFCFFVVFVRSFGNEKSFQN